MQISTTNQCTLSVQFSIIRPTSEHDKYT